MYSQFQVAAGDVWVSFKSEPSQFQKYLSTSEREQFSANFITVIQKHMPALGIQLLFSAEIAKQTRFRCCCNLHVFEAFKVRRYFGCSG